MTSSMEHVIELLEYLPDEVRKKCVELQKLDLLHEMKGTKLKEDSTAFFTSLNCLAPFEREKQHKELQQRHQEIREIADAKIQIAEYLQSAMEKYQERVIKDLVEFKTELESDNQAEVEIIEKTFMQSVTNPNTQNDNAATGVFLFNDDDSESASGGVQESILGIDQLQTANANGNCQDAEATPRSHLCQQRLKHQPYEDFKIPSNFRRPSQSVDSRGSLPRALDNEDIFDAEYSPSIKRSKPLSQSRQVAVAAQRSTKNSREASPHSSISSSSPRSTPPLMSGAHSSKHSSLHSRFPSTESSLIASTSAQQGIPTGAGTSFRIKQEIGADQQQQHLAQARQSVMMKMPSFAGPQASRHGRPRKLTKKVEQMLISNRTKSAAGPSTSAMMQRRRRKRIRGEGEEQLDEIDEEEFEEEEEYEGEEGEEEEADDRAWCYCKQGSAGNMVACDNKNCPYEWFHYECVGITQPPRGTWHCPTCSMKINATNRSRSASFDQAIQ